MLGYATITQYESGLGIVESTINNSNGEDKYKYWAVSNKTYYDAQAVNKDFYINRNRSSIFY